MPVECDAILFDLDGVLVDSVASVERNWRTWADDHGLDPTAILRVAHGQKTIDTIRRFAPGLDVEEEARRFAERESTDLDGVLPVRGASGLVEGLPATMWAVVTSGSAALALARMHHVGLPIPETLVTADDVTKGKPAPEPYLLAARRMEIAPADCVVVEDSPPGIEAARAAGMRVIGLLTTHAREQVARSDVLARDLAELRLTVRPGARPRLVIETG
jgi:sugar-phosphatase